MEEFEKLVAESFKSDLLPAESSKPQEAQSPTSSVSPSRGRSKQAKLPEITKQFNSRFKPSWQYHYLAHHAQIVMQRAMVIVRARASESDPEVGRVERGTDGIVGI